MPILDRIFTPIKNFFRSAKKSQPEATERISDRLAREVSTTTAYLFGNLPNPYNPDDLVGKKGLKIYTTMSRDEQVKACMTSRQYAVIAGGWEIVPGGEDEDSKESEKQSREEHVRFIRQSIEKMPGSFETRLLEMQTAYIYGFSVAEKIFAPIEEGEFAGKVGLKDLKYRNPEGIDFQCDAYGNLLPDGVMQANKKLPSEKFLIYSYRQKFANRYGDSDFRDIYKSWWLKENLTKFMAIALERYGQPTWVFTRPATPGLSTIANDTLLQSFMQQLSTQSGVILPTTIVADPKYPAPRAGEAFVPCINLCDTWIRIGLLMPGLMGLSAESQVGSLARSETEFDIFTTLMSFLRLDQETAINESVIKQAIDFNYQITDGIYPKFRYKPMTEAQNRKLFQGYMEGLTTGVFTKLRADEVKARSMFDMPPLPDDIEIAMPSNQQPPGGALDPNDPNAGGIGGTKYPTAAAGGPPGGAGKPGGRLAPKEKAFADAQNYDWDEAAHPRGQTTEGTTAGSFAPSDGEGGNVEKHVESLKQSSKRIVESLGLAAQVEVARTKIATGTETKSLFAKDGQYTAERQALHESIANGMIKGTTPQDQPTFLMSGGLPGSGKSSVIKKRDTGNYVKIDSDDIKRELGLGSGPDFEGWNSAHFQTEADDVIDLAFGKALNTRRNIVFDATLKSKDKFIKIINGVKKLGYRTEIAFVSIDPEIAMRRALDRWQKEPGGRFVDPEYIATHDGLNIKNFHEIKKLVDAYEQYDNSGASPVLKEKK